jgi:hypothetical protein
MEKLVSDWLGQTDRQTKQIHLLSKLFYFYSLAVSYNQLKFCPSTTWNLNAITFAQDK